MAINVCQKLRQLFCPECNNDNADKCRDCWVEVFCDLIKTAQDDKWIPVTERLPEYADGHVLVTDGERVRISCRNAFYNTATGETRCAQGYGAGMSVTHWMPMPAPPEEV